MTESYLDAIKNVKRSLASFCKFISANDVGRTGGHQSGYYVSKDAAKALFNCDCIKGTLEDRWFQITWPDGYVTTSRFVYYGQKSRDESRITNFGRGFEFMKDDYIGSLLIISKNSEDSYTASVLSQEEDINEFIIQYNIPLDTKCFLFINEREEVKQQIINPNDELNNLLLEIVSRYDDFPETTMMSKFARDCYNRAFRLNDTRISEKPDSVLGSWLDTETSLFYLLEDKIYQAVYSTPFNSVADFTKAANEVLNRRKSRAGKSLEHHLAQIFTSSKLKFEEQCITEDNKKPDFIFPGGEEYHSLVFPCDDLVFLGAKTTCKDRWRQVLNEADKIKTKYLFTLQPGISSNQLKEMSHENLHLVVPHNNIHLFAKEHQGDLLDLKQFIDFVHSKQDKYHFFVV